MANDESYSDANIVPDYPSVSSQVAGQPGANANVANTAAAGFGSSGVDEPYVGQGEEANPDFMESQRPSGERAGGDYLADMGPIGSDTGQTGSS